MLGVGSSIPRMAEPFLSTSKNCPKNLKLELSSRSMSKSPRKLKLLASSKSCPVKILSLKPSLSVMANETLLATFEASGILLDVRNFVKPKLPKVISDLPKYSSIEGFLLITLMAPPVEF